MSVELLGAMYQHRPCATAGCTRPAAVNHATGELYPTCCRTCSSSGGARHGPSCVAMKAAPAFHLCATRGCKRAAAVNHATGEQYPTCCRTCASSGGAQHGPACIAHEVAPASPPCATVGCMRTAAVNHATGEQYATCCRTCLQSGGAQHGPQCVAPVKRAAAPSRVSGIEDILDYVRKHDVPFLRPSYFFDLHERGQGFERQQDILTRDPGAFLSEAELRAALEAEYAHTYKACGEQAGKSMRSLAVVVSHPWLSAEHPDPHQHHLRQLVQFLKTPILESKDVLDKYEYEHAFHWGDGRARGKAAYFEAVFMDFTCLPQRPRTQQQDSRFQGALADMLMLYSSDHLHTVRLQDVPSQAQNNCPYLERGWCHVEKTVCLTKSIPAVTDFGKSLQSAGTYSACMHRDYVHVVGAGSCDSSNLPETLADMGAQLEDLHFASKHDDKARVTDMYSSFFAIKVPNMEQIIIESMDIDWNRLFNILRVAKSLRRLTLCTERETLLEQDTRGVPALRTLVETLVCIGWDSGPVRVLDLNRSRITCEHDVYFAPLLRTTQIFVRLADAAEQYRGANGEVKPGIYESPWK